MRKSTTKSGAATEPGKQDQIVTPATGSASSAASATSATSAATAPSANTPDDAPTLDEAGRRAIRAERDAAKEARRKQTEAEGRLNAVLAALGLAEDKDTDPAVAAKQAQKDAAEARAEAAVLRVAYKAGADPDALLDSKRFTDSLDGIDVQDREALQEHIKEWVEENPRYAARQSTGGTRDAAERRGGGKVAPDVQPGTDRMAHAIESQLNK